MAWWQRRRAGGSSAAHPVPGSLPERPAAWRTLPPVQRVVTALAPIAPRSALTAALSSWRDPRFLAPLGHLVDPDGPAGRVDGLVEVRAGRAVQRRDDGGLALSRGAEAASRPVRRWFSRGGPAAPAESVPDAPAPGVDVGPPPTVGPPTTAGLGSGAGWALPVARGPVPGVDHGLTRAPSVDQQAPLRPVVGPVVQRSAGDAAQSGDIVLPVPDEPLAADAWPPPDGRCDAVLPLHPTTPAGPGTAAPPDTDAAADVSAANPVPSALRVAAGDRPLATDDVSWAAPVLPVPRVAAGDRLLTTAADVRAADPVPPAPVSAGPGGPIGGSPRALPGVGRTTALQRAAGGGPLSAAAGQPGASVPAPGPPRPSAPPAAVEPSSTTAEPVADPEVRPVPEPPAAQVQRIVAGSAEPRTPGEAFLVGGGASGPAGTAVTGEPVGAAGVADRAARASLSPVVGRLTVPDAGAPDAGPVEPEPTAAGPTAAGPFPGARPAGRVEGRQDRARAEGPQALREVEATVVSMVGHVPAAAVSSLGTAASVQRAAAADGVPSAGTAEQPVGSMPQARPTRPAALPTAARPASTVDAAAPEPVTGTAAGPVSAPPAVTVQRIEAGAEEPPVAADLVAGPTTVLTGTAAPGELVGTTGTTDHALPAPPLPVVSLPPQVGTADVAPARGPAVRRSAGGPVDPPSPPAAGSGQQAVRHPTPVPRRVGLGTPLRGPAPVQLLVASEGPAIPPPVRQSPPAAEPVVAASGGSPVGVAQRVDAPGSVPPRAVEPAVVLAPGRPTPGDVGRAPDARDERLVGASAGSPEPAEVVPVLGERRPARTPVVSRTVGQAAEPAPTSGRAPVKAAGSAPTETAQHAMPGVQRAMDVRDPGAVALAAGIATRDADGSLVFAQPGARSAVAPGVDAQAGSGDPALSRRPAPAVTAVVQRIDDAAPAGPAEPSPPSPPPAPSAVAQEPQPGVPATGHPSGADLDELARRLFDPLSARLKDELRLDRERAGLVTDLRH